MSRPAPAPAPGFQREFQRSYEGNRPAMNRDNFNNPGFNRGNFGDINRGNVNTNRFVNRQDININNNRNTVIRRNDLHTYGRPAYEWNGHRFYGYHPYAWHGYHPYAWGAHWHPWGYFVGGALAATAVGIVVGGYPYYWDYGVWYTPYEDGYMVVQAPIGGTVETIPPDMQTVVVNGVTYYYYGGAFYQKTADGYEVVAPPAGAVVDNLPEGAEQVQMGNQTYFKLGETYYQPVVIDGQNKYEVVQVEGY
jgi:hypothetical protein